MSIVTPGDVEARLGRDLTADEIGSDLVETLIEDAENMIRNRLPGRVLTPETVDVYTLKQVVGSAVARVLRNPDGYRSEGVGGVSYTIDTRAAAGFLTVLADEWTFLGLPPLRAVSPRGSFAPALSPAFGTPRWWPWE